MDRACAHNEVRPSLFCCEYCIARRMPASSAISVTQVEVPVGYASRPFGGRGQKRVEETTIAAPAELPEWVRPRSFAAARTKMVRRSFVNSFPFNSGKNGSDQFGP